MNDLRHLVQDFRWRALVELLAAADETAVHAIRYSRPGDPEEGRGIFELRATEHVRGLIRQALGGEGKDPF